MHPKPSHSSCGVECERRDKVDGEGHLQPPKKYSFILSWCERRLMGKGWAGSLLELVFPVITEDKDTQVSNGDKGDDCCCILSW